MGCLEVTRTLASLATSVLSCAAPLGEPGDADVAAHMEAVCLSLNSQLGPVFPGALEDI